MDNSVSASENIIVVLPEPYADELLYSVMARYFSYFGIRGSASRARGLYGWTSRASVGAPMGLSNIVVASRIAETPESLAYDMTLFPYYTSFFSGERRSTTLKRMTAAALRGHVRYSFVSSMWIRPYFLRFCNSCRHSDLHEFGRPIGGAPINFREILFCLVHCEPLLESTAGYKSCAGTEYVDATEATQHVRAEGIALSALEQRVALVITERSVGLLQGKRSGWDPTQYFADTAISLGTMGGLGQEIRSIRQNNV